ncbi:peptidoglycan DD-metalloendopeptidase family protein [Neisseriaceae bacterium ESL0693]|nr:peptidoglycan DD-metalloendopeptidase family protein [Neisseriaceae bacterium ESL0693]
MVVMGILSGCANQSVTPATVTTATTAPAGDGYYRVQRGDNLYRIGLKYGQNVNTLMRWNHLKNADAIEVGQLIRVKRPENQAAMAAPSRHSATAKKRNTTPSTSTSTVARTGGTPNVSMIWPVKGQVVTRFNGQTQKGIDIAGTRGTPVKAAAAGTVQYAGEELRGYGKLILIKHSASTMTAYAYNERLLVRNGQHVSAGQQIATMGDSGSASGVRLHFEIRVNSQAVDPLRYLPR